MNVVLSGSTRALAAGTGWDADYPFDESNAYGDVFSAPAGTFALDVCWEKDLQRACEDPAEQLEARICDGAPGCRLHVVGRCAKVCVEGPSGAVSCRRSDGTYDDHPVHRQEAARTTCSDAE
jgi:hypothetical protein